MPDVLSSTIIVKIVKASEPTYWYVDLIGETHEVSDSEFSGYYISKEECGYDGVEFYISKDDCVIEPTK